MRRPPLVLLLLAVLLAAAGPACGNTIRPAAATVNGRDISQDELAEELGAIQGNADYMAAVEQDTPIRGKGNGTLDLAFVARVLTRQVFLRLIQDELRRLKLDVTPTDMAAARSATIQSVGGDKVFAKFPKPYQDTLVRRTAEVEKLRGHLSGVKVDDDAAVKRIYDENPGRFAQTCVSHILFAVVGAGGQLDQAATAAQAERLRAEAEAVRAALAAGADFAALAKEHSQDTDNRDRGGDLGCGPAGRFVPEFETPMDALAMGEVSQPVQTPFGWHLIKVTGRPVQTLEEAAPQIRGSLQGEGEQRFSAFLQEAVAKAKVSVNPRYGSFSTEGSSAGVVPPVAPTTTEAGAPARGPRMPGNLVP